jgi:hypothetical protein
VRATVAIDGRLTNALHRVLTYDGPVSWAYQENTYPLEIPYRAANAKRLPVVPVVAQHHSNIMLTIAEVAMTLKGPILSAIRPGINLPNVDVPFMTRRKASAATDELSSLELAMLDMQKKGMKTPTKPENMLSEKSIKVQLAKIVVSMYFFPFDVAIRTRNTLRIIAQVTIMRKPMTRTDRA